MLDQCVNIGEISSQPIVIESVAYYKIVGNRLAYVINGYAALVRIGFKK